MYLERATATTLTQCECCAKARKWHHSYLPVFLKDGLVSLLEHALQWHHFLFQLANQDEVIRASRIHRLSDGTTGGKEKKKKKCLAVKERMCQRVHTVRSIYLSPLDGFVSSLGFFFGVSFWMLHQRSILESIHLNVISQHGQRDTDHPKY